MSSTLELFAIGTGCGLWSRIPRHQHLSLGCINQQLQTLEKQQEPMSKQDQDPPNSKTKITHQTLSKNTKTRIKS